MPLPLDGGCLRGEPEPVEGERGAGAVLGDPGGGVGPGGGGELADRRPQQARARLGVVRLAVITVGGEEPSDPCLSLGAAVVHDVDGPDGVALDADADLLAGLADDGG